ncbi:hypothetical protein ENSA5_41270 [Enhygromyxa salina]|uniref:APCDD1 domain-containing protein n=1 Tax=Enhygromyxa salina TaxID=215803 RepID=A0A2S9XMU8_9BACT|nr:hypothetical protein ENSA5_41270 [Enhygromyxa salina]
MALVVGLGGFVLASWLPGLGHASTVAEQRARLPPPATCKDPIAGVWKSHSYDQRFRDWTIFTLELQRTAPGVDEFEGRITNHSWVAEPHESSPPPCRGELRYLISMDAKGHVRDGIISVYGVGSWKLDEVLCGSWNMGYNLDHFSGQIDPELMEFQSVNNDGGRAVNDPVVFRRVHCNDGEQPDQEPRIAVAPPPFTPPEEEGGGCGLR